VSIVTTAWTLLRRAGETLPILSVAIQLFSKVRGEAVSNYWKRVRGLVESIL